MFIKFSRMKLRCSVRSDTRRVVTWERKMEGSRSLSSRRDKLCRQDWQIQSQSIQLGRPRYVVQWNLNGFNYCMVILVSQMNYGSKMQAQ